MNIHFHRRKVYEKATTTFIPSQKGTREPCRALFPPPVDASRCLSIGRSKPTSTVHSQRKLGQKCAVEGGKVDLTLEMKGISQEGEELFTVDLGFHRAHKKEALRSGSTQ